VTQETIKQIKNNPDYIELISKRKKFAWRLTISMLFVYYAFIMTIAFSPTSLAYKIGDSVITVGIPIGIGIIVFAFVITGIYVKRSNSQFDSLTDNIKSTLKDI